MLQIKRIDPHAMMPTRATEHSAGLDLYASEGAYLPAHASTRVHTGIALAVPVGYEVQVRSRSGLAAKHGVHVLNSPGTIDADYRGEVQVILRNASNDPFRFWPGERIAQLVIARVEMWTPEEVDELPETARGIGGFGSTGR